MLRCMLRTPARLPERVIAHASMSFMLAAGFPRAAEDCPGNYTRMWAG